jgi:hypothetical protein
MPITINMRSTVLSLVFEEFKANVLNFFPDQRPKYEISEKSEWEKDE